MADDDLYYDLKDNRKTIALIFNHYFENTESQRDGTNEDCERINNCFKTLGFDSTSYQDYSYDEIREKLEKVSRKSSSEINCIIVVVMTHGNVGDQLASSQGCYSTKSLFQPFMDKDLLAGVPKLFFIQACRGSTYSKGYTVVSSDAGITENTDIPFVADFLCMYSTYKDNYSIRNKRTGSWFIQALCDMLEDRRYQNMELLQLLTFVINKVAYKNVTDTVNEAEKYKTQLPQFVSTLSKFFKFHSQKCL